MKFKIIINEPRSPIDGWTGYIKLPDGRRIWISDICGGAAVSFNNREKLVKSAWQTARRYAANYGADKINE